MLTEQTDKFSCMHMNKFSLKFCIMCHARYKGCTTWHFVLKACVFSSIWPETSETSDVQAVLIDCSSVIFVDVAGARLFTQVSVLNQDHHALNFTLSVLAMLCVMRRLDSVGWVFPLCCRCAPNARKLEFTCICPTATVGPPRKFSLPSQF